MGQLEVDGVALLERAVGYTLGGLQLVTPAALSRPTTCAGWDLRTLLLHMNESLRTLHEAIASGRVDLDPVVRPDADFGDPALDPVASLRNRACRMLGAWVGRTEPVRVAVADRGLPSGLVAATGAVEVAVHGWDVARACGSQRPVPDRLAAQLLALSESIVGDTDRPAPFGEVVPVALGATPGDRLVAFLGRRPTGRL